MQQNAFNFWETWPIRLPHQGLRPWSLLGHSPVGLQHIPANARCYPPNLVSGSHPLSYILYNQFCMIYVSILKSKVVVSELNLYFAFFLVANVFRRTFPIKTLLTRSSMQKFLTRHWSLCAYTDISGRLNVDCGIVENNILLKSLDEHCLCGVAEVPLTITIAQDIEILFPQEKYYTFFRRHPEQYVAFPYILQYFCFLNRLFSFCIIAILCELVIVCKIIIVINRFV